MVFELYQSDADGRLSARYPVCRSLDAAFLDDRYEHLKFVRIHRSTIVNVDRVREILREGRSEGSVILASGRRLRMSKVGWQRLLAIGRK
ncbi:MAG TPA: LytTR family DNA-binding domain-containing protein [Candidatus Dormibacteraeota bacterium]|nr:LytTR family DNA-binding domain-containing protein [Candidatus Dormibacteraeota bacterium]